MKHQQPDRIIRTREASQITGYTDVHLRRLEAAGQFPKRFKLADDSGKFGAAGWKLSSIQKWIDKRASVVEETNE
jgi:predicted DNA-binding transcriptional regulator AlpA